MKTTVWSSQTKLHRMFILIVCSFLLTLSTQVYAQGCATSQRLVKTDFFDFGPAGDGATNVSSVVNQFGWTGSGTGTIGANTNSTRFQADGVLMSMTQPVTDANLNGNGATIILSIATSDFSPRNNSNGALFRISYGGTVYCTITNPNSPDTDPENATVVYGNGATGPGGITSTSFPVTSSGITTFNIVTILLPVGIPNNGDLVLTFDAVTRNDDFAVESVSFLACPQVNLPVTFGSIKAGIEDDVLSINWSSLTEDNNDHFDIEASLDGKTFKKIGEVTTKATDGNSSTPLNYTFTNNISGMLFTTVLGILLFAGAGSGISRSKKYVLMLLVIAGITAGIGGCKKDRKTTIENDGKLFVRIAQVDIDGTKQYSKIVQATRF